MIEYKFNDGGRKESGLLETKDCTVRALSIVSGKGYKETHKILAKYGRKDRKGFAISRPLKDIAKDLGIKLRTVKRSGSLSKLMRLHPKGVLLVKVRSHVLALIDGEANDTFRPSEFKHVIKAWLVTLDKD